VKTNEKIQREWRYLSASCFRLLRHSYSCKLSHGSLTLLGNPFKSHMESVLQHPKKVNRKGPSGYRMDVSNIWLVLGSVLSFILQLQILPNWEEIGM
jgi:hypothetical protein